MVLVTNTSEEMEAVPQEAAMDASPRYFEVQDHDVSSSDGVADPQTEEMQEQSTMNDQASNMLLANLRKELEQERPSSASLFRPPDIASLSPFDEVQTRTETPPLQTSVSVPEPPSAPREESPEGAPSQKSEFDILSDHLLRDPHDGNSWQSFVVLVEQSGDLDIITKAYDRLLEAFPNTPSAQIAYLTHLLTPSLFPKAEALFSRFLRPSPSVDLWKFYLIYIRRVNPNPTDLTARQTIKKAYEFALNHIGQDKDSGEIWRDYIDFLKTAEANTTWDAQQKMDSLRSAYHRAVLVPIENVETLWRELDAFETNLNKITAKKFLGDLSPSYMTARTTLRDLRRLTEPLSIPTIKLPSPASATPPALSLPSRPTWVGETDRALCHAWKTYLKWEESNPLDIEDNAVLQARISGAYKKAVIRMRFFPEIWFMAYTYTASLGKPEESAVLLKQGMDANRSSFLLHFAYAELQESQNKLAEVHKTFESLIGELHDQLEGTEASINAEVEAARASVPSTGVVNGELAMERDDRAKQVLDRRNKELEGMKGELGVVWTMLMRFARRAEGLKPARTIFSKARKDKYCPWGVYEAAALMEYHCTKAADVATKIFEIGLKLFGDDPGFVVRYLGFLISINDENNARALFERVVGTFSPENARPLWERWARYEYHFGDLAATQKLEKRISEVYPNDPPIKRFAQRYTYLGIDAIADRDLGFAYRNKQTSSPPTASTPVPTGPAAERNAIAGRRPSPEPPRRRRDPSPPAAPSKRFKPSSPPPPRRDRERDRDRDDRRDERPPPPRRPSPPSFPRERDDDRNVIPNPVLWFLGTIPSAAAFDGPVFRTDDLMELLRHGNIPAPSSASGTTGVPPSRVRSPPPARGRPPPDYGPYQGPGSSKGRRY